MTPLSSSLSGSARDDVRARRPLATVITLAAVCFLFLSLAIGHPSVEILSVLFDLTSLIITAGGTFTLLLLAFGARGFIDTCSCLASGEHSTRNAASAREFLRFAATASLMCGLFGTLAGAVMVLRGLADPAALGPAVALVLLSQIYGVVQASLCWCAMIRVGRNVADDGRRGGREFAEASSACLVGVMSITGIFVLVWQALGAA
ncbi:MAG: MotA/TolQ/ExbB proton channel family protein [Phycisphaerae bacterium]|nr:MAG: hypothetical protein EDS66_03810 [Planctomycetota bacterium]KAB2946486.1 MAG: hypothetical protein F9K17_08400 [Phycisphaerae bacterium]MBE7456697.1 MotA/TolQ/ExbB proton channel family protein [Planctomycetia bacterium]MCK6463925.1 MotA/TolQ/ExbB proton channel family protein [Phycisphaerae bacterium]MCL4718138.1 MotA/TolQ/ExbB proton channel family protein [Phycisphaerae bacterium]